MDERQQYYAALLSIFELPGWKYLTEDIESQIESAQKTYKGVTDMRQLGVLQGREQAFEEFLTLEGNIKAHMAELEADDADLQL